MTKSLKCREHNGNFMVEARRGRPPVKCNADNPCDAVQTAKRKLAKATGMHEEQIVIRGTGKPTRKELAAERERLAVADKVAVETNRRKDALAAEIKSRRSSVASEPRSPRNRSVPLAQAAKAELEAVGWTVQGRAYMMELDTEEDVSPDEMAEITAVRGAESLVMVWSNGSLMSQDYSMWHSKPSKNHMPARRLKFNPDEMTDNELIRAISGMKVTYWNTLGKSEESYVVSGEKLSIEHFYSSNGDEDSARRMVKFIDLNGNGFRHFHVDSLLKVG